MYIVPIAWLYVAILMSAAEATSPNGTLLGAAITFVIYGALPVALMMYFMGTPGRKRAIRAREMAQRDAAQTSRQPDASRLPPADPIAAVGKEP